MNKSAKITHRFALFGSPQYGYLNDRCKSVAWSGKGIPIVVQECLSQKLNDSGVYTARM